MRTCGRWCTYIYLPIADVDPLVRVHQTCSFSKLDHLCRPVGFPLHADGLLFLIPAYKYPRVPPIGVAERLIPTHTAVHMM